MMSIATIVNTIVCELYFVTYRGSHLVFGQTELHFFNEQSMDDRLTAQFLL